MQTFGPHIARAVRFSSFPGFYNSILSSELDHQEEQQAEYLNEQQEEDGIASELRLTEEDFAGFLFDSADYRQMHEDMAEGYAEALDEIISEFIDMPAGITFHSMWSPREYNFSTDELTIWIPEPTLRNLMVRSLANGHAVLGALVKETFKRRSGFIPNYSDDISEWLVKPMAEWDDIELGLLLESVFMIGRDRDDTLAQQATYLLLEGETPSNIVSQNIDWTKFEKLVDAKRAELQGEINALEPDYVPPARRCHDTPDMFERHAA